MDFNSWISFAQSEKTSLILFLWLNLRVIVAEEDYLEKKFSFKNFSESQKFVNEVGNIAETERHHPDIIFGWGYAKIQIFTHKIKGLVESDFILAAKVDKIKF